jgi:hypothetical protein
VYELEAVNELLKTENERLARGESATKDALLSHDDLLLLRKLTASAVGAVSAQESSATLPDKDGPGDNQQDLLTSIYTNQQPTKSQTDYATALPTTTIDVTDEKSDKMVDNFEPAALRKPLQKELPSSLISLRRTILAAMMTPKMTTKLQGNKTVISERRVARILLGSKRTYATVCRQTSGSLLTKSMFATTAMPRTLVA